MLHGADTQKLENASLSVSFEFFPARSDKAKNSFEETVATLSAFQPDYCSVTFGAGGSSLEGSLETADQIKTLGSIPVASHITHGGSTRDDMKDLAERVWEMGIRKLVALRGDTQALDSKEAFSSTADFVAFLCALRPFEVAVACYPETHPRALSRKADLQVLKDKQDAGAAAAITQFFFDSSVFYAFEREARDAGIHIPIIPGVLPIYNYDKTKEMAKQCGAAIPDEIDHTFARAREAGVDEYEVAAELLKSQVTDLAHAGYETIHIYTLNKPSLSSLAAQEFLEARLNSARNKEASRRVA